MFSHLSELKKAGLFYVLAMALTLSVSLLFRMMAPEAGIVVIVHMMTPTLAAILMLFVITRDGYSKDNRYALGLRRFGWRTWWLALLLPLLVLMVSFGLAWLSGAATLVLPTENSWLPKLFITLLSGLVVSTLLALGEEIGFRGYLLPRLLDLGTNRALILSGFLFATWHLPLMFLIPVFMPEGNLFLVIPIFLLLITLAGVIYGALRLATDSIWPSTIMHGAFNALMGVFTSLTVLSSPVAIYLVGESGLFTVIATALVALWLIQRQQTVVTPTPALDQS
jgi:membrane protease YdiL (CAAX protease family)